MKASEFLKADIYATETLQCSLRLVQLQLSEMNKAIEAVGEDEMSPNLVFLRESVEKALNHVKVLDMVIRGSK